MSHGSAAVYGPGRRERNFPEGARRDNFHWRPLSPARFFLLVTAQDGQWIIGVILRSHFRSRCIRELDLFGRNDFKMSFQKTRRRDVDRCGVKKLEKDERGNPVFQK